MRKLSLTVFDETVSCKIVPSDIDTSNRFWDAFGNVETETSALWIVRLCQERGRWCAFTKNEIEEFYARTGKYHSFQFNSLVNRETSGDWVILGEDGKYRVTQEFILRCYTSSPAKSLAAS